MERKRTEKDMIKGPLGCLLLLNAGPCNAAGVMVSVLSVKSGRGGSENSVHLK